MVESLVEILTIKQKNMSNVLRDKSCMRGHFFNKQVEYCE